MFSDIVLRGCSNVFQILLRMVLSLCNKSREGQDFAGKAARLKDPAPRLFLTASLYLELAYTWGKDFQVCLCNIFVEF